MSIKDSIQGRWSSSINLFLLRKEKRDKRRKKKVIGTKTNSFVFLLIYYKKKTHRVNLCEMRIEWEKKKISEILFMLIICGNSHLIGN